MKVNDVPLQERDALEIRGGGTLKLSTESSTAHLLLVEMKYV